MFKKNISDGVGSRNESIHTPLDPPLFWLDNIFKGIVQPKKRGVKSGTIGTVLTSYTIADIF